MATTTTTRKALTALLIIAACTLLSPAPGLHLPGEDGIATIHIYATHDNPEIQATWWARTLLHEVAHAWIDQNVTDEAKDEFIASRNVDNWADGSQDWEHRGTEHAAEVLMWGLQGGDYDIDFRLDGDTTDELTTAFATLTQ